MNRFLIASFSFLAACHSTPPLEEARSNLSRVTDPVVSPADAAALVAGNNTLATSLHRGLANAADGNFVWAPYSISFNMAMVRGAIAPEMKAELDATLGFTLPDAQLDPAWDALDLSLTSIHGKTSSGSGQQLLTASAFWSAMPTPSSYLDTLALYYGSGVLNGKNPMQAISAWQATLPGDALPFELAQPCDEALVSFVHLDAAWQTAFDSNATRAGDFHKADGSVVSAPMMFESAQLAVATSNPPAVEIPYDGDALSMLVIVPDDLSAFEASLTPNVIADALLRLHTDSVDLTLPKLKFSSSSSVLPAMQALGLPLDSGHWQIWHAAQIAVDENGTIASAMTTTSHTPASVKQTTSFLVNRPFAFFIRDRASGSIVFAGHVVDPTK